MELQELRQEIDRVDDELVRIYVERMELIRQVGDWKRMHGTAVRDAKRERELLDRVGEKAGKTYEREVRELYEFIMSQSRSRQAADSGTAD